MAGLSTVRISPNRAVNFPCAPTLASPSMFQWVCVIRRDNLKKVVVINVHLEQFFELNFKELHNKLGLI
jgi:hypothetical protein